MPRTKKDALIERYTQRTQQEVADALGITPQRVGQLEKSAFAKLRAAFLARGVSQREPAKPFPHGVLMYLAQTEREAWLWRLMTADCDLSESRLARDWKIQ